MIYFFQKEKDQLETETVLYMDIHATRTKASNQR